MSRCRVLWFLALSAGPLIANPQASSPADNTAACVPQAYIANLLPIFQPSAALPESAYEKFDDGGATIVSVTVLVTVGPQGTVTGTEALDGPEFLRKTSTDAVRHYKYRPVIRNGQPVCALTSARVLFQTPEDCSLRRIPPMNAQPGNASRESRDSGYAHRSKCSRTGNRNLTFPVACGALWRYRDLPRPRWQRTR